MAVRRRKVQADGVVPVRRSSTRDVRSSAAAAEVVTQIAADAWSVGSNGLPAALAGVETKLFQYGLFPYLGYLYFLSRGESKTPPLANFGARFLLLFVAATIPAGIAAKVQYGDILANVDVLHGTSESLLTVSNFFFALGFARALATPKGEEVDGSVPLKGLSTLFGVALAGCVVGAVGAPALLAGSLHEEPQNALSLPTWAVHVSSVTEWAVAMSLVWAYGDYSGNKAWKGLTWAMSPFLASGLAACTFHTFYNNPEIGALVPLQALLTFGGNTACAFAAYRVWEAGKNLASTSSTGIANAEASAPRPLEESASIVKLALFSAGGAALVKYGELLAGDFPFQPNYAVALGLIFGTSGLITAAITSRGEGAPKLSMDSVKSFGVAGTVSYILIELAFWAIAFPVALSWYKVAEGSWLDLSDPSDKAKLLGAGAVFINGVRLLVPLRLGAAIALAPTVEKALKSAGVDIAKDKGSPAGDGREGRSDDAVDDEAVDGTWSITSLVKGMAKPGGSSSSDASPVGPVSGLPSYERALPDCPRTRWDADGIDLRAVQTQYRAEEAVECPLPYPYTPRGADATASGARRMEDEEAWVRDNADDMKAKLLEHGCLYITGLELTKKGAGFRRFYEALDLDVCLDPIHTSGLRKFATEEDGIYEEVNKPGLRQHYIGLHNESTTNRSAAFGAFVCFQPATEEGGEFFIADGKAMVRDMDIDTLETLYSRKVRISVSNLDFFKPIIQDRGFPNEDVSKQLVSKCKEDLAKVISDAVAPKFDMDLDMVWGADGANDGYRLQAIELPESPVNRHPVTKEPVWFCNIQNHSRYLRNNRPCTVPEVGMTETFYGDLSPIPEHHLDEVDRVSRKNIVAVPMKEGDVLLVDNYRVLHGRDIFKGDRYHAVSWFTWPEEAGLAQSSDANTSVGDSMNKMLNKYVDSLAPK